MNHHRMMACGELIFGLAVALSLSIGWGIRGNYGHETGAMIPGALAALAAVALARRNDWLSKAGSFAFFGAFGWSFGGSISYMQVIAYTHSGHSLSVLYGFACLFIIGFLWAIFGGVGTALPAFLSRAQLTALYPLVLTIFAAWCLQDVLVERFIHVDPAFRQRDPLYWYDTDWLGISVALTAVLLYAAARRKVDFGVKLTIWLCAGWWSGFVLLVLLLGWRMTPPRGDNWAGCAGMAIALGLFLVRERLPGLLYAGMVSGIFGGLGFAGANCLKLMGISTGLQTNWHSVLEQSYGLINGIGIAVTMLVLRHRAPAADPEKFVPSPAHRRVERLAAAFILVAITYLNLRKNVEIWVKAGAVPAEMYSLSAAGWFNLAYLGAGGLVLGLALSKTASQPWSESALARVQWLYLAFLWWMVLGNFERSLVHFAPERLVTEGVIFVNTLLCSALILLGPARLNLPDIEPKDLWRRKLLWQGLGAFAGVSLLCWGAIRLTQGDQPVGYASRHIRFGPNATATPQKPSGDKPHP